MEHELLHYREQFPILSHKAYLASHSLGAVPSSALAALQRYYVEWATQGIAAWDGPWWSMVGEFSAAIEDILGAPPGTVVPMLNATRAMGAVASCFEFRPPRNRIVLTELEFPTSYALWRGCERLGAEIVIVASPDGLTVPVERIAEAIDERTLILPLAHAYFRSGALQDLRAVTQLAHAAGAYVLGDGYQTAGTVPVDVLHLGVDFYVGGCHKWLCGGPGAGFLYVRRQLVGKLEPRLTGWFGLKDPFAYERGTQGGPRAEGVLRFLDGTPNVPGLYAAWESVKLIREIGVEAIRAVSAGLTEYVVARARRRGFEVTSPARVEQRNGMICMRFSGDREAVPRLAKEGIVVDWRPDCGMRVSPHFYSSRADIDRLFDRL